MNTLATPAPQASTTPPDGEAFASIMLWSFGDYFLQIHHGYFDSWEEAEDFPAQAEVHLEESSAAVFLLHKGGRTFIPDGALQVFRNVNATALVAQGLTLDDLIEEVALEDMRLIAIGHTAVTRGLPILARDVYPTELTAANDSP